MVQPTASKPVEPPPTPPEAKPVPVDPSRPLREVVGGTALIRLPVSGFEALSLKDKLLTYHLYRASVAGRDITYDQNHRHALDLRYNLEQVLLHSAGIEPGVLAAIREYTKLVLAVLTSLPSMGEAVVA